jgi:hypothetical protein
MCRFPVAVNYLSVVREHQALVDIAPVSLLQQRIDSAFMRVDAMPSNHH